MLVVWKTRFLVGLSLKPIVVPRHVGVRTHHSVNPNCRLRQLSAAVDSIRALGFGNGNTAVQNNFLFAKSSQGSAVNPKCADETRRQTHRRFVRGERVLNLSRLSAVHIEVLIAPRDCRQPIIGSGQGLRCRRREDQRLLPREIPAR